MDSAVIVKVLLILDEFFIHVQRPDKTSTIELVRTDARREKRNLVISYELLNGCLKIEIQDACFWAKHFRQGETDPGITRSFSADLNNLESTRSVLREIIVFDAQVKPTETREAPSSPNLDPFAELRGLGANIQT